MKRGYTSDIPIDGERREACAMKRPTKTPKNTTSARKAKRVVARFTGRVVV